jgi:hypothetical protein
MSLDDLTDAVESATADLGDVVDLELDRETRHELAMLTAATGDDPDSLLERAIHLLFQTTVDTGKLDFHLRNEFDVTYDEFLAGITYEETQDQYEALGEDPGRSYHR